MVFEQDTNNFYHFKNLFQNNDLSMLLLCLQASHQQAIAQIEHIKAEI